MQRIGVPCDSRSGRDPTRNRDIPWPGITVGPLCYGSEHTRCSIRDQHRMCMGAARAHERWGAYSRRNRRYRRCCDDGHSRARRDHVGVPHRGLGSGPVKTPAPVNCPRMATRIERHYILTNWHHSDSVSARRCRGDRARNYIYALLFDLLGQDSVRRMVAARFLYCAHGASGESERRLRVCQELLFHSAAQYPAGSSTISVRPWVSRREDSEQLAIDLETGCASFREFCGRLGGVLGGQDTSLKQFPA